MMCTPFLVYTYVIHTYIALHCALLLHDCTFSPVIFKLPLGVHQRYIQLMCTTTLGISLEYYILAHGCLNDGFINKISDRYITG